MARKPLPTDRYYQGLKPSPGGYLMKFKVAGITIHRGTGTHDRAEAREILLKTKAEELTKAGISMPQKGKRLPPPSLGYLVERWEAGHVNGVVGQRHLEAVPEVARRHLAALLSRAIDQIRISDVEALKTRLLLSLKPVSVNHVLRVLRLLLRWGKEQDLMFAEPPKVRMLRIQQVKRATVPLNRVHGFFKAVDRLGSLEHSIALRFMMFLGFRASEVVHLQWQWLDFEAGSYCHQLTKGHEATTLMVPKDLLALLRRLGPKPQGFILTQANGRPHHRGFTRKAIHAACKAAGLPLLSAHRLRATFATLLAHQGIPLSVVQRLMRHKDIKTTMGYIEVDQAVLDEAQTKFEAALLAQAPKPAKPAKTKTKVSKLRASA